MEAPVRILDVDLTAGSAVVREESVDLPLGLKGKALGIALLEQHLDPQCDPLGPENVVILTSSAMAAYGFPGSNRGGAFTRSPLTGRFLETYSGGTWGRALRDAGWDAVVIRGATTSPVRLEMSAEGGSLSPAGELWGKDVFETDDLLSAEAGRRTSRLVIGPGAENLVAYSSVHDGKYHAMGRGGLGAIFGAKRLKAITIPAVKAVKLETDPVFDEAKERVTGQATDSPAAQAYRRFGTPMLVALMNELGGFPARYWHQGEVAHRERLEADSYRDWADVKTENCAPCPVRCKKRLDIKEGRFAGRSIHGPEYESIYAFGGLCMIEDPQEVAALHEECNRLGIDVITAGNAAALAMDAGDRGVLDQAPAYGDYDATVEFLRDVASGSGPWAELFSHGTKPAAEALGMEEAIQVKGMDPAGYDPRATRGMDLAYATSPRGACHLRATFYKPALGGLTDGLDEAGVAELFTDYEDRLFLHDCLTMCRFYRDFLDWETLQAMVGRLAERPVSQEELRETVRDLLTRIRRLSFAMGMTAEEDRLPSRFFEEELERAPALDRESFRRTMDAYYELRGWPGGNPG